MSRTALPRIALLVLIWGSAFLWIKLADRGFSPVEVTLARLAMGTAVLFAVMLARRAEVPRSLSLWAAIVTAALFANAVPYLLFALAEQTVNSSTAGIINAASISYEISYVYMDRFLARRGISAIVLSACQLAAAVMLAIALGVSGVQTPHMTAQNIAAITVLGVVGTGFAYC